MKAQNAVVGGKVQIKRDCRGHSGEVITKGLVCAVTRVHVRDSDYELRLKHPAIAEGYAWVNASDCRKYIEPDDEATEDVPVVSDVPHDVAEGTLLRCIRSFTSRHKDHCRLQRWLYGHTWGRCLGR